MSGPADQRRIFLAVVAKLRAEHPFGAWPSLWESLLETGNQYSNAITIEEREAIERLRADAERKRDESNSHNSSSPDFLTVQTPKPSKQEVDSLIATLVSGCDPSSASSIDKALKNIQADDKLDYACRQRFIVGLRAACPYPKRLAFLLAVCDAVELNLTQSLDILAECFAAWSGSSTHIVSNAKALVERLFECKSAELFEGQFTDIARGIRQLSGVSGDKRFVLQLVLRKVPRLRSNSTVMNGCSWPPRYVM